MALKIYNPQEKESGLPRPRLRLDPDLKVVVVDIQGNYLATIFFFGSSESRMLSAEKARGCIQEAGYSTDWGKWDKDGRFLGYSLKEIELDQP